MKGDTSGYDRYETFIWFVTIYQIPNKTPASHAQISASPASQGAGKSQIPSRYLSFSRVPHRVLVKSRIPGIPFQTLLINRSMFIMQI